MHDKIERERNVLESKFLRLYKIIQERNEFLSNEAKIIQYSAIVRFFMKFLHTRDDVSVNIKAVLFWTYTKLGDIYYEEALQNQDNSKYFLAIEYYNQSLMYALNAEDKNRVLFVLRDLYYYLGDENAILKIEETWAENHNKEGRFSAYMFLAQNAEMPYIKAKFLEKALDEVMEQDESFYTKYQDTLNICSQLLAIYELLGDKTKANRIKKLRENTLKLLN